MEAEGNPSQKCNRRTALRAAATRRLVISYWFFQFLSSYFFLFAAANLKLDILFFCAHRRSQGTAASGACAVMELRFHVS